MTCVCKLKSNQVVVESVEDFLENFECVGSFSQDKKEPNSIVVPGCPPLLDWRKMEAEEGEITLVTGIFFLFLCLYTVEIPTIYTNYCSEQTRQAENAPELNTTDSIFKSVSVCSPDLDLSSVDIVTNR